MSKLETTFDNTGQGNADLASTEDAVWLNVMKEGKYMSDKSVEVYKKLLKAQGRYTDMAIEILETNPEVRAQYGGTSTSSIQRLAEELAKREGPYKATAQIESALAKLVEANDADGVNKQKLVTANWRN